VHFLAPAKEGETLVVKAACNRAWTSSMEIGVKVLAENTFTGDTRHIVSAYLTFVALDSLNQPVKVPQVEALTADEIRRFDEAEFRRNARLATKNQLRIMRGQRVA
jgi:acyl-CoA hydrolase